MKAAVGDHRDVSQTFRPDRCNPLAACGQQHGYREFRGQQPMFCVCCPYAEQGEALSRGPGRVLHPQPGGTRGTYPIATQSVAGLHSARLRW